LRIKCFACDLSGDVFALVAAVHKLDVKRDFKEVKEEAAQLAGVTLNSTSGSTSAGPGTRTPPRRTVTDAAREETPAPQAVTDVAFDAVCRPLLYMGSLERETPANHDVREYLARRRLLDAAVSDGWGALPPAKDQDSWVRILCDACAPGEGYQAPAYTWPDLQRCGLLDGPRFRHPENRLVIPYRNRSGLVVNLQRRRLDAQKEGKYTLAGGRSAGLYGLDRYRDDESPVAFCEGALDTLALRLTMAKAGEPVCVIGIPGTQHWKAWMAELARGRLGAIATDSDDAGNDVEPTMNGDLTAAGATKVERWKPTLAKDWADDWLADCEACNARNES
jgi:hypothetical protein